jgi:hypothetical protein
MQNVSKYSNDERAILSTSDVSAGMLNQTDEKLQFASEELLRMEDEGGRPLTQKQTAKISAYAKARKQIKALLFTIKRCQPDFKVTQE